MSASFLFLLQLLLLSSKLLFCEASGTVPPSTSETPSTAVTPSNPVAQIDSRGNDVSVSFHGVQNEATASTSGSIVRQFTYTDVGGQEKGFSQLGFAQGQLTAEQFSAAFWSESTGRAGPVNGAPAGGSGRTQSSRVILIKNLPNTFTAARVIDFLHGYGPISAVEIVVPGVAKLTFVTQNEADRVLRAMHGYKLQFGGGNVLSTEYTE